MTVDAAASVVMTLRPGERFARRVVTGCAVLVVAACFGFSFGNVLALGRYLAVPEWVAWLVAPAVDLTLVGLIVGCVTCRCVGSRAAGCGRPGCCWWPPGWRRGR